MKTLKFILLALAVILLIGACGCADTSYTEATVLENVESEAVIENTQEEKTEEVKADETKAEVEEKTDEVTEVKTEIKSENETVQSVKETLAVTDKNITIVSDKKSEYIIVYERRNDVQKSYAEDLAKHISSKYGVTIPCYQFGDSPETATKRIVIGDAHENVSTIKGRINSAGDFIVDVVDDDLIIYASTEYMYKYMFDVIKREIITGEVKDKLEFSSSFRYIFSQSKNKDLNYAEYYKSTLTNQKYTYDTLLNIFEAKTYSAYMGLPYRMYVPSDYDETKEYPLITILHGAGERGNDNKSQLKNMVVNMFNQENSPYTDAIIICPQCPANQQWVDTPWANGSYSTVKVKQSDELTAVVYLVESVRREYSTDEKRCIVMGISMGGFGAWDLIMRHSDIFTKAVCLCGGADPRVAAEIKNVPVWIVHSSNDSTVPYSGSKEMADALEKAGSDVYVFETKESNHNVWDYAGNSTEIANWIFE